MDYVYRVEHFELKTEGHKVCWGPYNYQSNTNTKNNLKKVLYGYFFDEDKHPTVYDDYILRPLFWGDPTKKLYPSDFFFGFDSLARLQNWFFRIQLAHLHQENFVVRRYYSSYVIHGDKQSVFHHDSRITRAETINIQQLLRDRRLSVSNKLTKNEAIERFCMDNPVECFTRLHDKSDGTQTTYLDEVMLRESWNNFTDELHRNGLISDYQVNNWVHPKIYGRKDLK